jgi:hypothetical protein
VSDTPDLNLARRIVSVLPPFVPSSSRRVTNEQCIRDSEHYLQELNNLALWALKSEYGILLPLYKPLEAVAHLNNIYKFSVYRKENTTVLHDNDQLINAV